MNRMFSKMLLGVLLLLTAPLIKVAGQPAKAETLTNKNVIEIAKAGLGNDVIISKINSSVCKFDVSTPALIDLKKQGVSSEIINAMLNKANGKVESPSPVVTAPAPVVKTPEAKPILPVIALLNVVHYYSNGATLPLEKALGNSKSKKVAFGYGGSNLSVEIDGGTSPVKLGSGMADSFVINMGSSTLPDLALYKLKAEKNKRSALVGKLTIGGPKSGEGVMPIEITKISDGLYGIKPGSKLDKGEYFFAKQPDLSKSLSASDVSAFSVQ